LLLFLLLLFEFPVPFDIIERFNYARTIAVNVIAELHMIIDQASEFKGRYWVIALDLLI
jgi:hypothetical protein